MQEVRRRKYEVRSCEITAERIEKGANNEDKNIGIVCLLLVDNIVFLPIRTSQSGAGLRERLNISPDRLCPQQPKPLRQ